MDQEESSDLIDFGAENIDDEEEGVEKDSNRLRII